MEAKSDKEDRFKKRRKELNDFRDDFSLNECFVCKGISIDSHSIPKQLVLDKIKGNTENNQQKLYAFENTLFFDFKNLKMDYSHRELKLSALGKKEASVFNGFCSKHEMDFFTIENNCLYNNTLEHKFLHSYRAYAYSIHREIGMLQYFQSDNEIKKSLNETIDFTTSDSFRKIISHAKEIENINLDGLDNNDFRKIVKKEVDDIKDHSILFSQNQNEINNAFNNIVSEFQSPDDMISFMKSNPTEKIFNSLKSVNDKLNVVAKNVNYEPILKTKQRLIELLETKKYSGLDYKIFFLDKFIPLTCALTFNLNNVPSEYSLCIIPDCKENKTVIIFSTFFDTKGKEDIFNKLANLNNASLEYLLSSIILKETTNTYLSPEFYQSYSEEKKQKIFEILNRKNRKISFSSKEINLFCN